MDWKPDICIYHFPCDDGFGAAWCVWKKWGEDVDMRPSNYGLAVPDENIDDKNILIADFSFKPDVVEAMAERAKSIVILDHHKTAQADLDGLHGLIGGDYTSVQRCLNRMTGTWREKVLASFDMKRSGARMTWNFCFPGEPMPELIKYIEDRDLWKMSFDETRALSLYLRSFSYDFELWNTVMERFENDKETVLAEASAIERFYDRKVTDICDTAVMKKIGQHEDVPVVHAPYAFASDCAHELLQRNADAPFAACVVDAHGGRTYSLRSEDSRIDVSEVAKTFGGGGHRNAAGFRMPL